MQRIRTSLPYFKQFGWDAEVVTVDQAYSDMQKDYLLLQTIPADIKIYTVNALNKKWTSKIGFGNLAFRSYWFYRKKVNELLKQKKFDLIYFSTTQFTICVLGAYWKKRFKIPYVIDMQDPWHTDYYQDKPKHQQPSKYWFSYRLNKFLEPIAIKNTDGLISVSENYIIDLKNRYPEIKNVPSATISFGSFEPDMEIAEKNKGAFPNLLELGFKNVVYIGRGGFDMHKAITPVFKAFKQGLNEQPVLYGQLKFYFIGTSYAPHGKGDLTILPLARQFGIENHVIEMSDRIGYFHTLATLQQAHALFIPGSDDPMYTASKIYPYLLTNKPLLAIFNSDSPANGVLQEYGVQFIYNYNTDADIIESINNFLINVLNETFGTQEYDEGALKKYSAKNLTSKQCELFTKALSGKV